MANWQWILFWILVSTPFALNLRRALRARARNHRPLLKGLLVACAIPANLTNRRSGGQRAAGNVTCARFAHFGGWGYAEH